MQTPHSGTGVPATQLSAPILVLGGAHAGKSELAIAHLAPDRGAVVIGTAHPTQGITPARLAELRALRPPHWDTLECGTDLPAAIADAAAREGSILVDSVSQWLAQVAVQSEALAEDMLDHELATRAAELVRVVKAAAAKPGSRLVLVSAEVGAGPAPARLPERLFRRHTGLLNRKLAEIARTVVLVHAGIPQRLKG